MESSRALSFSPGMAVLHHEVARALGPIAAQLDAIPSETTPAERRFLFGFASEMWSGANSLLEVGPFLGGTTRALALGMLANPRRQERCKLFSYDRFTGYL